jgi:hypothetical protein
MRREVSASHPPKRSVVAELLAHDRGHDSGRNPTNKKALFIRQHHLAERRSSPHASRKLYDIARILEIIQGLPQIFTSRCQVICRGTQSGD